MSQGFEPVPPVIAEPRKGHGCLFWGCITMLVLSAMALGGIYAGYRFVAGKFQQLIETYTDTAPQPIPTVEMPEEERQALLQRAEAFRQRFESAPTPDNPGILTDEERTLVLTADELNVLLQRDEQLKGRFYVTLEGDQIKTHISLPLSELDWDPLKGRYLNGEARVVLVLADGEVQAYLRDVRVKGQPLPEPLRAAIEKQELTSASHDPQSKPSPARKFERLEVQDGRLVIVLRKEPNLPSTPPAFGPTPVERPEDDDAGRN